MTLLSLSGIPTHFPRNGDRTTISDLTFARNQCLTAHQSWSSDPHGGGNSDHALLTTFMSIAYPSFSSRRQFHEAKWDHFRQNIGKLDTLTLDFNTRDSCLQVARTVDKTIQEAINVVIPCSKPGARSKGWWTSKITILKLFRAVSKKKSSLIMYPRNTNKNKPRPDESGGKQSATPSRNTGKKGSKKLLA